MSDAPDTTALDRARARADLGMPLNRATRFRFVKRVVYRISWLFLNHQVAVNHGLVEAQTATDARLDTIDTQIAVLRTTMADRLDLGLRQAYAEIGDHIARAALDQSRLTQELQDLVTKVESLVPLVETVDNLERTIRDESSRMHLARAQANIVVDRLRRSLPDPTNADTIDTADSTSSAWDDLYLPFEDEFRGTREEIKKRLSIYITDLEVLDRAGRPVLDIGCGRGDWLEVLAERGIDAYGIDLNRQSVDAARSRGLDAQYGDAFAHLEEVQTGSIAAVTAFHLVEHITIDELVKLLDLSFRVLMPGGLLIVETPNPNNLTVGINNFYLDPTHRNPVPSLLLAFLAASSGFEEPAVRQLSRTGFAAVPDTAWATLDPALTPLLRRLQEHLVAGEDYAVLARRP